MKKIIAMIIFLGLLPWNETWAAKLSLYQAELPVVSQSQGERAKAIKNGFLQVLIKVTGDSEINRYPAIKSAMQKADSYVQEYSYLSSGAEIGIQIRYNENDINALLKNANIAYWGENRPLILVWLVMSRFGQAPEMVGSDTPDGMARIVKQLGQQYGVPMIFPVMDVEEMGRVSIKDVTSMALSTLDEAGKRYAPNGILIGNITSASEGLASQWRLVLNAKQWDFTVSGKSMDEVAASMMSQISQALIKEYAVKPADQTLTWVKLQVNNVKQKNDLSELMQYLKQLTLVRQVQLSEVSVNTVELSVLIHGTLESFQQNASINNRLSLQTQGASANTLVYEWMH